MPVEVNLKKKMCGRSLVEEDIKSPKRQEKKGGVLKGKKEPSKGFPRPQNAFLRKNICLATFF